MRYIEPHAHMVSRTTDDYERMALAGCQVICEPAFWAGFDRSSAQGFYDYFRQLTGFEPARAARFGIRHFAWMCINPKEAEDTGLAREVLELLPEFLAKPNVLGVGEIGLNKNSRNELAILHAHLELAEKKDQMILIHTPHLEDKLKGTRLTLDALREHPGIRPERVIVDHVEEHTIRLVLDAGCWAGMTLYPHSKCSAARAVDMMETCGMDRLWMNSACDWGVSDPLAVPRALQEMRRRGFPPEVITRMAWDNPCQFLSQSPKFAVES
ncbi:MAG TPA: TatD family hydrolase [Kiritimatiellia bacterium]|nr:TatD family hydrolase [Kiritimatiellia bacterium]HMO98281.1 TatD family hydrolase [Kiritimatiellia bacterium]HMP96278.1 TatD family hydrolase [Kiritimatiellia bacterium]